MDWAAIFHNDFWFKAIAAVLELIVGMFAAGWMHSWIMKMKPIGMDKGVLTFAASASSILVRILAVIIALGQLGVKLDILVGAFSAVGLGVSLALKESMANVAGGLQILITKPFAVGDYIEYGEPGGVGGTVTEIELMFTSLQTPNMQQVVIPNASLVSGNIINYSTYSKRRIVISTPVSSSGDYESFRKDVQHLLDTTEKILKDPAPITAVSGFTTNGNGMTINIICYTPTSEYWGMLYYLNEQIQLILKKYSLNQPTDLVRILDRDNQEGSHNSSALN